MLWIPLNLALALALALPPESLSFSEALDRAQQRSQVLQIRELEAQRARSRLGLARGELFPELEFFANWQWQDRSAQSDSSAVNRARSSQTLGLRARQNLFQGGAEFAGFRVFKEETEIQRLRVLEARLELTQSLAHLFFSFQKLQKENESLSNQKRVLERRIRDLRQRTRIGRSQEVDLLAAESQLAALEAELIENEFQKNEQETKLKSLLELSELPPLREESLDIPLPEQWEDLERIIPSHFRMQQMQRLLSQARAGWRSEISGFLPELEAVGQYFFHRPRPLEDVDWSLQLNLSFNFFSGGKDWYRQQAARHQLRRVQVQLAEEERLLRQDLRLAFEKVRRFERRQQALLRAAELAEKNSLEQQRQYELGLVSNLDVLQSMNQFLNSKRLSDRASYELKEAEIELLVRMGESL